MDATILRRVAALAALVSAHLAAPLGAQGAELEERMRDLQRAVDSDRRDSVAAFFPRSGGWSWVQSVRDPRRDVITTVGRWRFSAGDARRAIGEGGPLCESFEPASGGMGPYEGRLGMQLSVGRQQLWRRVGRNRFVPPRHPDHSQVFVEWRREAGVWVISTIGDETVFFPRLAGRRAVLPNEVRRGAVASPARYATDAEWYKPYEPLVLDGERYNSYGRPRPLSPHEIEPIGAKRGVAVYVARGDTSAPDVLYLPVDASNFQPYQTPHGRLGPCR
jgi:hypothetical protein